MKTANISVMKRIVPLHHLCHQNANLTKYGGLKKANGNVKPNRLVGLPGGGSREEIPVTFLAVGIFSPHTRMQLGKDLGPDLGLSLGVLSGG